MAVPDPIHCIMFKQGRWTKNMEIITKLIDSAKGDYGDLYDYDEMIVKPW